MRFYPKHYTVDIMLVLFTSLLAWFFFLGEIIKGVTDDVHVDVSLVECHQFDMKGIQGPGCIFLAVY